MSEYSTIKFEKEDKVARITFCRPEIHNAFNSDMIRELTGAFNKMKDDKDVRVIVMTGEGKSYCAGADLNWMRAVKDYSYEQNLKESLELAALFRLIYEFPRPVIGRINGAAIGGGTGFVAVTDIAIAADTAIFSFSEVKIGVVPACISPYVVKRVGEGRAREFFLTGERLTAQRALEAGLVNQAVQAEELDTAVDKMIKQILTSGPDAIGVCKDLLHNIANQNMDEAEKYTAEVIANLRKSPEGQEGMDAFLNKRKPNWVE
ncbi:MAG: enoyl-CoA hydratase/isomerase family protein [candidate division Zixibacteria bacterium]|nr:enoyl-CoA hydratase/isomerase family protein [candidate division Zixibacteria bacterium]NIR63812.1 enoyl-CoA hydratase/isomerase family protein [candidate division Zixibacteria bacterium]NIS14909.1 enoyl-CoA hydratase/isomerase family protein [candidate division Zixibacteria bacterium]NIS45770.1 enoyl-CoA hydratase/isomerase family protein [candidate division Zixibacteria bacterium]NIT51428.1 enoyl-CoA hydratase/isomerase family protein [candidate division Zixibacteria bacterium]